MIHVFEIVINSIHMETGSAKPPLGECLQLSTLPSWGSAFPVLYKIVPLFYAMKPLSIKAINSSAGTGLLK